MSNSNDNLCPHSRDICRREFLKMIAATSLLTACNAKPSPVPSPTVTTPPPLPTEENLTSQYIAYCGYDCTRDSKYPTTCAGCLASNDQKLPSGTLECVVRACNIERGVANCAHCEKYPCDKLETMFAEWGKSGWATAAKTSKAMLDEVHQTLP